MEQLDKFSKQIGDTLRYVSFSIIGICFSIMISSNSLMKEFAKNKTYLILILTLSILSLAMDYLHSLMGFINEQHKYIYQKPTEDRGINVIYYLGHIFFYLKQVCGIFAVVLLLIFLSLLF